MIKGISFISKVQGITQPDSSNLQNCCSTLNFNSSNVGLIFNAAVDKTIAHQGCITHQKIGIKVLKWRENYV